MKTHLPFHLLLSLLLGVASLFQVTLAQLKPFGNVIVTSQEAIHYDLNDYYVGNNITISASDALIVTHKFNSTSTPQNFPLTASIAAYGVPKDLSGDLDQGQPWFFVNNNFSLATYTSTYSPTPVITASGSPLALNASFPTGYQCVDILRFNKTNNIIVSCLQPYNPALSYGNYYVVSYATLPPSTVPAPLTEKIQDGKPRYLAKYPNNDQYLITYPKSDPNCKFSAVINIYDISTTTNLNHFLTILASNLGTDLLCLQSLKVLNETIFIADFSGGVYRVDHIFTIQGGIINSFQLTDNILEMIVVDDSFDGKQGTTVIIETQSYMYHYDWTDPQNPVLKDKYAISPINATISQVLNLEITQDFISTTVVDQEGDCHIMAYYVGQSRPDDVYYISECPIMPNKVVTTRSFNSMFILTTSSTLMNLYMYQLSREILSFTTPPNSPGFLTSTLTINDNVVETLNISVIDPLNYSVIIANAEQSSNYGITVPGQSTFNINGLLNGPLLTYTSSDSNYNVQSPIQNVVFSGATVKTLLSPSVALYQPSGATYIYLIQMVNNTGSVASKCTLSSSTNYKCTATAATLNNQTTCSAIAAYGTEVYSSSSGGPITIQNFVSATQPTYPSLTTNSMDQCLNILISNSDLAPYLYCLGGSGIYIFQINNLTNAQNSLVTINTNSLSQIAPESNPQAIAISNNFPSILFFKTSATIYLINTELLMLGIPPPNAIISNITVPDPNHGGFNFTVGGNSILIYRGYDMSLIEYDISHPHVPVLLKTTPVYEYQIFQFLSSGQQANNIYIYGYSGQTGIPVALVYQPQMPGNSNYLTTIPLPTDLFNPSVSNIIYPQYPVLMLDDSTELFLLPYQKAFGWIVSTDVEVLFNSTNPIADSDATDYEETVQILFTGTHNGVDKSSAIGQVSVDMVLTDQQVKANATLYYDSSISMSSGFNKFEFDPRTVFNGAIDSYTLAPQESSDTVTLINQAVAGADVDLNITSIYWLTMINRTVVAQGASTIYFVSNGNFTKLPITAPNGAKDSLTCNQVVYNSELQFLLTTCLDKTDQQYYYLLVQYTASGPINYNVTSFNESGKQISNVQKVIFTSELVFVLENFGELGGLIHVFKFNAPSTLTYQTTVTGADLNTNSLTVVDFDVNFLGTAAQYRLYIIDPNYGLRMLDATVSNKVTTFGNPQLYSLPGPANANWNGILAAFQQGDFTLPIALLVTSSNYKNYYVQYTPTQGVTILRTFVPIPNANVVNPCYADGQNFVISAYGTKKQEYALVYSISNMTSNTSGQNFPLLTVQYTATSQGACGLTFDTAGANGATFYYSHTGMVSQYTVSPNISIEFNGKLDSDYITITASSSEKQDSIRYYLVPPPSGGTNLLFLWIILGVVGLVIIVVLIWYCNAKYKKRRNKIDSDSYYGSLPTKD